MVSESEALLKDTIMPVYVTPEDEQLLYMYEEVKHAAASRTSSILVRGKWRRRDGRKRVWRVGRLERGMSKGDERKEVD